MKVTKVEQECPDRIDEMTSPSQVSGRNTKMQRIHVGSANPLSTSCRSWRQKKEPELPNKTVLPGNK